MESTGMVNGLPFSGCAKPKKDERGRGFWSANEHESDGEPNLYIRTCESSVQNRPKVLFDGSSRYGVSYSLAVILPGLYSFYMLGLAKLMPYKYSPIALLALGGLLLSRYAAR